MFILHSKTQINDHLRVCNIPKKFRIKKLIPNIYNFLRIHPSTSKQYFTPLRITNKLQYFEMENCNEIFLVCKETNRQVFAFV